MVRVVIQNTVNVKKKPFIKRLMHPKYLLLAPSGIFFALTMVYFLLWLVRNSFYKITTATLRRPVFIGLENYSRAFRDPLVHTSMLNTVIYFVIITVALQLVIGFLLALLVNRDVKGRTSIMTVLFVPAMMAPLGIGLIWRYLLNTHVGFINQLARLLNLPLQAWLSQPTSALWAAIFINVWQFTPFVFIILLAGFRSLPTEPFEAAAIDGASKLQTLRYLTLPLLKPMILVAAVFRVTDGFRLFDLIWALTAGGPGTSTYTLTLNIYREAFMMYDLGYSSAISILLLLIIFLFSGALLKLLYSESVL